MGILDSLGVVKDLVGGVKDVVDEFHTSGEEKGELALKLEQKITERLAIAGQQVEARFQMVANIIESDNKSGDAYTRRARPTVVYFGLAVILINHVLVPLAILIKGVTAPEGWSIDLPEEFWMAWGGVVATWTVSRSAERLRSPSAGETENKIYKLLNG